MPVLFNIGPFNVYSFGFFLALSFVLSTFIIHKYAKDEFKEDEYMDSYFYMSIVMIVCARIFYIILNFNKFGSNFIRYFLVRETPGLSLLGGLAGGFIFLLWFARKKKHDLFHLLDIFSIALSFSLVLVKIGEQLGGAGFGKETNWFLAVNIIGQTGRRHPVEFYEALVFLILAVVLCILYKSVYRKKAPNGILLGIFALTFSLQSYLLEFLKISTLYLYGLSLRQVFSLLVFAGSAIFFYRKFRHFNFFPKENNK